LLTTSQRERIEVVLVAPRNPLNIGAAARAMANFGLTTLSVVDPFERTWREARSAVGAPDLLLNATESTSFPETLARCTLVIGTGSLTYRKPEQPIVPLPELSAVVEAELQRGGRVGLVFGPENHGLSRDDLSYCHLIAVIPTCDQQPSMNLGQAVAVCLYELTTRASVSPHQPVQPIPSAPILPNRAVSGNLEIMTGLIERTMLAAGYSPKGMQEANRHDLRLLLRQLNLTEHDARRILGLFRRILWRLERNPGGHPRA
jgi:tRNA/rRNA methyltransferase